MITLNVGSAINGKDKALSILEVIQALDAAGLYPVQFRTDVSETETTYVICTTAPRLGPIALGVLIYGLSVELRQDAIAFTHNGQGSLVGPKAAEWGGSFDPARFIPWSA